MLVKNNKRYFIITVDTEGDNQWDLSHGISTENVHYLPRFQQLCEKYEYKPVWLTNYEMCSDSTYVEYMKPKQEAGLCEIGMHLHAWFTPPQFEIDNHTSQRDYLIEYPEIIMDAKIKTMTELIEKCFGMRPVSHRSGRWAMNNTYFSLIEKYGYKVDCSVTPRINWSNITGGTGMSGSDYSKCSKASYTVNNILEVPMTIRNIHYFDTIRVKSLKNLAGETTRLIFGRNQWLRPDKFLSFKGINRLMDCVSKEKSDYMMFMIHSSELMPGGSPNFQSKDSIESLYVVIEKIFEKARSLDYQGITLKDYYEEKTNAH